MPRKSGNRFISLMFFLGLCVLFGCVPYSQDSQLASILERKVLHFGTLHNATAYFTDSNGVQGFEYEMAKDFADYLGVELEVTAYYSLAELFTALDNHKVDVIGAGITQTERRADKYRFGPVYRRISERLVYRQGRVWPKSFSQVDAPIVVSERSSHAETLAKLATSQPLQWQENNELDAEELLQSLVEGQIEFTVADSHTLNVARRYLPELAIAFTLTDDKPMSWLFRKDHDDSLLAVSLEFFGQLQQNGMLANLEEKYYGHVRQFNYVNTRAFIDAIGNTLPNYKNWFEQSAGSLDWRLLAALSYQESMWDPQAISPTGVRGIMMLTQDTARMMGVTSRIDAQQNIEGGARYLERLMRAIPDRIGQPDKLWFALAAYNVGWGHVEDARRLTQRDGGDPDKWLDVKKRLPLLVKKRYYRTTRYGYARGDVAVKYVDNIRRYYDTLVWLDSKEQKPSLDAPGELLELPLPTEQTQNSEKSPILVNSPN